MVKDIQDFTGGRRSFRFLKHIGRGGLGDVYLAEMTTEEGFAKTVTVKLMRKDRQDPDLENRMRDEARMLGMLRHRAIVQAEDLVVLNGRPAVIMEYVPGVDWYKLVHPKQYPHQIPPRIPFLMCREVALALDAAFNRPSTITGKSLGVLHRDIKPGNIRITPDGEVKVLDFGIARASNIEREASTEGVQIGTLSYMAPELIGSGSASPASDLYALGVTLIESLSRQRFGWASETEESHQRKVAGRLVELDLSECGDQGGDIVELLSELLHFHPSKRPEARELARRCREIESKLEGPSLDDWALEAVPAVLGYQDEPEDEEEATKGGSLVGEVLTVAVPSLQPAETEALLKTTRVLEKPVSHAATTELIPARRGRLMPVGVAVVVVVLVGAVLLWRDARVPESAIESPLPEPRVVQEELPDVSVAPVDADRAAEGSDGLEEAVEGNSQKSVPLRSAEAALGPLAAQEVPGESEELPLVEALNPIPIKIASIPWGIDVFLDGEHIGHTPIEAQLVSPGEHVLLFMDGEIAVEQDIVVSEGGQDRWVFTKTSRSVE